MIRERRCFCVTCRKETAYRFRRDDYRYSVRGKEYDFEITTAVCLECGEKIGLPGLLDNNAKEIDQQYRRLENIVSIEDIQKLMELYNLGKAPLSLALGFGEITITRYLQGQVPSVEYSNIIEKALESPKYMMQLLNENQEKIGDVAYKKAFKAAEELDGLFVVSDKMLLTISYIFEKMQEVTPLALQKLLYYIQGLYMVLCDRPLFEEDCQAWVHGPVYEPVYTMFKTFRYNPIEDNRFAMFKNRFQELSEEEQRVIDLVIESFGLYSGKVLERITHSEAPWLIARENYLPDEVSNVMISKESIKDYFTIVSKEYDVSAVKGLRLYIDSKLQ